MEKQYSSAGASESGSADLLVGDALQHRPQQLDEGDLALAVDHHVHGDVARQHP
ncbi:hypothetical protein [Saccharopolyspora sp. ASAGF58]|uniref:hypothetical protein n=1 Tax=Saccharopolyspora sp. ASAGF58 TaxID=2719023 RepID=UPI001444E5E8|nr:hypothetical protein [Saccharopolyspora sp. ASAGF58]